MLKFVENVGDAKASRRSFHAKRKTEPPFASDSFFFAKSYREGCNFGPFKPMGESLWFPTVHEDTGTGRSGYIELLPLARHRHCSMS